MKIKIHGVATFDDVIHALYSAFSDLNFNEEKQCLNGVSIYFNVYEIGGNKIEYQNNDKEVIDNIDFYVPKRDKVSIKQININKNK